MQRSPTFFLGLLLLASGAAAQETPVVLEVLTLVAEWDCVQYSTILDILDPDNFNTEDSAPDDSDEFHAGLEYVIFDWDPLVAIRVGT